MGTPRAPVRARHHLPDFTALPHPQPHSVDGVVSPAGGPCRWKSSHQKAAQLHCKTHFGGYITHANRLHFTASVLVRKQMYNYE